MIEFDWSVPLIAGETICEVLSRTLGFLWYDWEVIDMAASAALVRFSVADRETVASIIGKFRSL